MTLRVVAFAGSLRSASFNKALVRAAVQLGPDSGLEVVEHDIADVPLFNEDDEAEPAAGVTRWRRAVQAADGVLISTPEYNHSMTAVTKNAIDWLSRPPAFELRRKPVAIMGASTGAMGSVRAQLSVRQTLIFTQSLTMGPPEFILGPAATKFDADGELTDDASRTFLGKFLTQFATWIEATAPLRA